MILLKLSKTEQIKAIKIRLAEIGRERLRLKKELTKLCRTKKQKQNGE